MSVLLPLDLTELLGSPAPRPGRGAGAGRMSLEPPAAGTDVQPWQLFIPKSQIPKGPFQPESFKKACY